MAFQKQYPGIILILLAFCFSLGGCGAPLLSERQIVRAVLFSQTAEWAEAVLLLANTSEADAETFHTLSGVGQTPAEALNQAQQASQGPVFYGLMDLECTIRRRKRTITIVQNLKEATECVIIR